MNKADFNEAGTLTEGTLLSFSNCFQAKAPTLAPSQSVLCLTISLADPDPVLQTEDLITLDLPADHCTVVNLGCYLQI